MSLLDKVTIGKQVARVAAKEFGANLLALNLYPFGLVDFREHRRGVPHPRYAPNERPILLVHGVVHNHSAFIQLKKRMHASGFKNIFTVNYSTRHGSMLKMVESLSNRVDQILERTESPQIDIVAHSLGGIVSRYFMSMGEGRGRVKKLVTLGTPHRGSILSPLLKGVLSGSLADDLRAESNLLKTLSETSLPKETEITSIYSKYDWTIWPQSNCRAEGFPRAAFQNLEISSVGHMGLLYSPEVLDHVMTCLKDS